MMRPVLRIATLPLLVGCGLADGPGEDPITVEHAATAGAALAVTAESASGPFDLPFDILNASCVAVAGDPGDPDGDGIPNAVTVTVNCSDTTGGVTQTVSGTIAVTDDDEGVAGFGFSANYNLGATSDDGQGNTATATLLDGTTAALDLGSYEVNHGGDESVSVSEGGSSLAYDKIHGWTATYSPDLAWLPGQTLAAGTLEIEGAWSLAFDDGPLFNAALTTLTPLHVNPACAPDVFDAGELQAIAQTATGISILSIEFNGCAPFTIQLDGQTIQAPDLTPPDFVFE